MSSFLSRAQKKRAFTLIEVLICLVIVSLAIIPTVSRPFYLLKKQKEKMLELAEKMVIPNGFYQALKELQPSSLDFKTIRTVKEDKYYLPDLPLPYLEGFGTSNRKTPIHCHIFHCCGNNREWNAKNTRNLFIRICVKEVCEFCHTKNDYHNERRNSFQIALQREKK